MTNLEDTTSTPLPFVDDAVITQDDDLVWEYLIYLFFIHSVFEFHLHHSYLQDNMTLEQYQVRSAYMLKPRRSYHRYTPEDWRDKGKGKGKALEETESEAEEEEPVVEPEPEQFLRRKLRSKRGRRP